MDSITDSQFFMTISDGNFITKLEATSKFKERADKTLKEIHLPELNARLHLNLKLPEHIDLSISDDPYAPRPDLTNNSTIEVIYLGNSMLERLKTTGLATDLGRLGKEGPAWNAGCGGDKNENVIYRLSKDMYSILKHTQGLGRPPCDIKLWVLASGTNNLHPKRPFRTSDVESYRLLLETCLRIAPQSRVVVCDMFYRKDVPDNIVDESNDMLQTVVQEINQELSDCEGAQNILWVEARKLIGKDMLVDHVHLTEEGYKKWDEVLWPHVRKVLSNSTFEEGEAEELN
ncbi:hypothetical protein N0V90_009396 [Kalmusia sp. IMI 367209]|nr:hypothetical protein N0V90_009396 [Kalmusia sp. IMI 367209]